MGFQGILFRVLLALVIELQRLQRLEGYNPDESGGRFNLTV